ncbi:putative ribonuclease H-like domain-containing protein [Tanacetum coccineum]|uniref:Ribonuclease H-like domain-containing protein n=1 Tax=Tanacetum coccineum TaxID=301880 RepID=A0ABQ4X5H5_9ASTR
MMFHPPTRLFSPLNFDLSNSSLEEFQQPEFEGYGPKTSKSVSKDISNEVREYHDAPLVKELVLDDKLEKKNVFTTVAKIEFADCNYHQRERVVSRNNYTWVNYNYSAKKAHPSAHRNMVPRAVLMKTSLRSLNTTRPVNIAHPKTTVCTARLMSHFSKSAQSTVKRPYQIRTTLTNKKFSQKVNTAKGKFYTSMPKAVNTARPNSAVVNAVRANQVNAIKVSACWVWRPTKLKSASITLKRHNYVDAQGRSKSVMAWSSSNLMEDMLPLGEEPKEGKLLAKGLLKLATLDESMLWHRRLGHENFKIINKLVKENLMRGLPAKRFENDQTCVACLKGKQHKASCKSKIQNSITQPLFMLHMDLFGLTFVSSLMNNKYCLVVTDDYSRFTWVFFLASKDETSGIFKRFVNEIENIVNKKVKIIRCDNGTKFKNRVMSEFCEEKGIKKEFSIARTPQQNGVAERRNRTLIEAARTMLADSKLPTTFYAVAVNTACYVHNRVLVVKPHNKTPYELFIGRTPALSFMRPFGCHVTILNTLDYLGKFDGKSDEGFFVRYSMNSKDFKVYNIRTRKVEENMHIRFLEDKPIIADDGPKWLFDIDVLTKSMNYVTVVTGTNSNDLVDGLLFDSSLKNASNDKPQPSSHAGKKDDEVTTALLEATHVNFFGDETEVDMSNITTTYLVPSIPNTIIHKDHLLDHVIGDVQSGVQTRRMIKTTIEQGFISTVYEGKTHEDLHTCLFACFLSQEEPKKVWTLVDLPHGKRAIGTKWVYMNKKDERGIVISNKARLVTQGYTQEEGIHWSHLKLEDFDGISNLPTTEFFEQLALWGPVVQGEGSTHPESVVPQPRSPTQTNVADEAASTGVDIRLRGATTTVIGLEAGQGSNKIDKTPTMPHDSPLPRVHTLRSDEDRMQHNELMDLVTKLSDRVVALETDLQQTKKVYGTTFTKLIKKVKKLEKTVKTRQAIRKARIVISDDEEDLEDPSKQERKIAKIDEDPDIYLE